MRWLFKIITTVSFAIAVMIAHLTIINIFPFPFNTINVTLVILIWLVIYTGRPGVLWLSFPLSFLLEIYSASPFGVNLLAIVGSLSLVAWLLLHTFTNRSPYIVFSAGLICLVMYRLLFELLLLFIRLFSRSGELLNFSWSVQILWSIGMSAVTLTAVYYVSSLFAKRLRPEYVSYKSIL